MTSDRLAPPPHAPSGEQWAWVLRNFIPPPIKRNLWEGSFLAFIHIVLCWCYGLTKNYLVCLLENKPTIIRPCGVGERGEQRKRRTDASPSLWVIVTLNMKISQLLIVGLWYFMRWGWWVLNMNIFYKWTIWLLLNVKTVWRKKDVTCFDYYSAKGKTRADKTRRKRRTGKGELWIGVKYTALALALCSRVKIR